MKKYTSIIFVFLLFLILSFYSFRDYLRFYNQENQKINLDLKINKEKFSFSDIQQLEKVDFYYTPNKTLLKDFVFMVENAKKRVYIEVYMFTENRLQEAIIKAKKKGIDVQVILEKNPYNAYNVNNKTYELLKKNDIKIVWSNTKNYSLNHSKIMIIDDNIVLSSGNLTYSTFAYNRDFFFFIKDSELLKSFVYIFENDFIGNKTSPYNTNLVLSPDYSRDKLEYMISGATSSLDIYFQYLKDEHMFSLLKQKAKEKIKINIILSNTASEDNYKEIQELRDLGVNIKLIKSPKIHAKAILVDKKYLFMGSENFSTYSLDKNREVGIIIKDEDNIFKFINIFKKDIGK